MYVLIMNDEYYSNIKNYEIDKNGFIYNKYSSFCVTKLKYISKFYRKGTNISIIELPDNNNNKLFIIKYGKLWEVNIIKIIKTYSLYDLSTYEELGLQIENNKYLMDYPSRDGKVEF